RVRPALVKPPAPSLRFQRKDTEQYHVCVAAPGISRSDKRRFAASLLDGILGGSASSRLFQEIREKRGMAYAVYSFASQYTDTGQLGIYIGTREDNLAACLEIASEQSAEIAGGKVGSVLAPALEGAGHELVELGDAEAMVDFTAPDVVESNVRDALEAGVPCVVGTTGWDPAELGAVAAERGLALFVAPNFAIGAVLMMRLAAEVRRYLPRAEIVELHNEAKKDAPSGTAKATAESLPGEPSIHS